MCLHVTRMLTVCWDGASSKLHIPYLLCITPNRFNASHLLCFTPVRMYIVGLKIYIVPVVCQAR